MKKQKSTILLLLVFLVGLSLLLYPMVSNYINSKNQSRAIASYEDALEDLNQEDYTALRQAAQDYNRRLLLAGGERYHLSDAQQAEYESLLDPAGIGVMGYVEIPAIGVSLPLYHGVEDTVLQIGAGHIPGSSLPVGGEGTHAVLSGHRGLPSSKLFTDLDKLEVGDVFYLHVLDETLAYEVAQIEIVLPEETSSLSIQPGADQCTLVTCTPYGINSHRLLLHGVRTTYDPTDPAAQRVMGDAYPIESVWVLPFVAAPILLALLVVLLIRSRRR